MRAKLIEVTHPRHGETMAEILLQGGIVGAIWGHHLYFLACNACNREAVARMNEIKGRPKNQVFVFPGAVEEAEEFVDFKKSKALIYASQKLNMTPHGYLEFLYQKFPLAFADKIDAIAIHPNYKNLKKLRFSTSSSVVSFIGAQPLLKRIGCTGPNTLKKYIPNLQIDQNLTSTRKR